ncbi:hypothetical protein ACHAPU_010813 [Fusarium lateritium]
MRRPESDHTKLDNADKMASGRQLAVIQGCQIAQREKSVDDGIADEGVENINKVIGKSFERHEGPLGETQPTEEDDIETMKEDESDMMESPVSEVREEGTSQRMEETESGVRNEIEVMGYESEGGRVYLVEDDSTEDRESYTRRERKPSEP